MSSISSRFCKSMLNSWSKNYLKHFYHVINTMDEHTFRNLTCAEINRSFTDLRLSRKSQMLRITTCKMDVQRTSNNHVFPDIRYHANRPDFDYFSSTSFISLSGNTLLNEYVVSGYQRMLPSCTDV